MSDTRELPPRDEPSLVARCRRGDREAWDLLFDEHYAAAGRFVFQLGPEFTREDVQEICQETFLAVVRNLQSFNERCRLQTWIFRIAANKARDHLDRQRAGKRGGGQVPVSLDATDPESGRAPDVPSAAPGPDDHLLRTERATELRQALDTLGDPCREILELRYFGDLSYDEIGAALKLNLKTVSSRLSKCLDRLEQAVRAAESREDPARSSV